MKIAFSDYDGTLSVPDEGVAAETIEAIHAWRSAGNKFGIVTGRDYTLIAMETRAHDLPVDFYICCNGATIHHTDGTPLISTPLSCEVMRDFFRSEHVRSYTDGMLFFTPEHAYTYRLRTDVPPSYLTPLNTIEEALRLKDVVQMGMRFRDREETLAAFAAIDSDFPNIFTGNMNRQFLDLNRAGVNKSMGIADFVRHMGWEAHDLFIIGDDRNDLAMIEKYGGYTVRRAQPFMHEAARAVYDSVGAMLRDHL
ncbi:HAD hydrolase family protein [uncultured Selenomonas sp.]|uniref:HAD hydrolase family protein n=1 Tax=uncultured Selenomonas sp. TaxID=159275 RepID=UPI0028EAD303|nr:HAD hydrolase family protein [uncultured Selenomonas sp.]